MKFDPAFNYDKHGQKYSGYRRTDPRIAKYIYDALDSAKTILNVGAGAGSYEPEDRYVVAVEPSEEMRSQRIMNNRNPAVNARAESLPFDDKSFDASMSVLSVHHWHDMNKGLKEMRRVTKDNVVIMAFDPDAEGFWNAEYFPDVIEIEKRRDPKIEFIKNCLGGKCEVEKVSVPFDCVDGFQEAFYGRPEEFLKKEVRRSQSAWGFISEEVEMKLVESLADDLASGEWDRKYGHYRNMPSLTCALRLVISFGR